MAAKVIEPPIAFSTLACPEWTVEEVVDRAAAMGYDAIEWRGGPEGHVSPSWPVERRRALLMRMADRGLSALSVTAYPSFVTPDPADRARHRDDLLRHVDLAADLGALAVRAFIGIVEDEASPDALVGRAIEGLAPVADRADDVGVAIAIEPHDDFVRSEALVPILHALGHSAVGAIWEIGNAWAAGEDPAVGCSALGPWIRYVQLKDGRGRGADWRLSAIGEGEVPLGEALTMLAARGPLPPLSVEWERAWHPELAPADVALGPALAVVRELARAAASGSADAG
jgi:sugar phosphate isomerase/epimerase